MRSLHLGDGTVFHILLPRGNKPREGNQSMEEVRLVSTRILVVDDEERYTRLMEANLVSEGYEVLKAMSGQEAVEVVGSQRPDLVLLDVMMPGINGFQACQRIREFSSVPIIMVTAKEKNAIGVRGLDVGADDYIVKPVFCH